MANSPEIPLVLKTAYADLLERAATADFESAFHEDGTFTVKTVHGRRYWYFQTNTKEYRRQLYVGPETEELLNRIKRHKQNHDDRRERRALVSTLVRSAYLPRIEAKAGAAIEALARAGVFRLRAVLVGTLALQAYPALLGVRLPRTAIQTGDVDIAQDRNISVAVEEKLKPFLEILRKADPKFVPIPSLHSAHTVSYKSGDIRIDLLTSNRGSDSNKPVHLPALDANAEPLRFLDFLIRDPQPAVLLHEEGVYVLVPSPEKYALHKLIVAQRRSRGAAKGEKDIMQARALLNVLVDKNAADLRSAWKEAFGRGKHWQKLLLDGLLLFDNFTRDKLLRLVDLPRSALGNMNLVFEDAPAHYHSERMAVFFRGISNGQKVDCAISREALEDHYGLVSGNGTFQIEAFRENREEIEAITCQKYLYWPIETPDLTLIKTLDVPKLRAQITMSGPRAT